MRSMQRFWGAYRNQAARVGRGISGEVVFKFFSLSLARNDLNLKDAAELSFSLLISTSKTNLFCMLRGLPTLILSANTTLDNFKVVRAAFRFPALARCSILNLSA
jgi:hypothetical protein